MQPVKGRGQERGQGTIFEFNSDRGQSLSLLASASARPGSGAVYRFLDQGNLFILGNRSLTPFQQTQPEFDNGIGLCCD